MTVVAKNIIFLEIAITSTCVVGMNYHCYSRYMILSGNQRPHIKDGQTIQWSHAVPDLDEERP
jgi:hypothetical protein